MSQLTTQLRPDTWDKVVGQDDNVELLKSIIKNPANAPKVLIFEGAMGTGKTSCARIFAREVNGMDEQTFNDNTSICFSEYDSSNMSLDGDALYYEFNIPNGFAYLWKVVFFDEVQAISSQRQAVFLKPLERMGERVFVIFATTDVEKILKPLRSRALEVRFAAIPYEAVLAHLNDLEQKLGIAISTEAKQYIAYRGHGHMRNVHMMVNRYSLQGEKSFMKYATTGIDCFCDFFVAAIEKRTDIAKCLNTLVQIPLVQMREDFDEFIIKCAQEVHGIPSNNASIAKVAQAYGDRFGVVVDIYFQKWVVHMFASDKLFHLSMMNFYKAIKDMA